MRYLERVAQACVDLEKRRWKVRALNGVLLILLISHMLTGGSDFSILGVSLKDLPQIREFLLIVIVSIEAICGVQNLAIRELNIIQETTLESLFTDPSERKMWMATLPTFWGYTDLGDEERTKLNYTLTGLFLFLLPSLAYVLLLCILALAYFGIMGVAWWQIFQTPNFSGPWNIMILLYTGAGMVGSLSLSISRKLVMPFKDFTTVCELKQLRETDGKAYQARANEIAREHENLMEKK